MKAGRLRVTSTEDKIEILKDCLRANIRKLLAFTDSETASELKQAASEIENLDEETVFEEKMFKTTKPRMKSKRSTKKEEIHRTAATIE